MDLSGQVPPSPATPPALPRNETLAVVSLVCGIASFALCLGPLSGIPAVICGHVASTRITQSHGALGGAKLALWGLILGYGSFLLVLVAVPMALLFPAVNAVKENARRMEAKNTVMQIAAATKQYQTTYGHLPLDPANGSDFSPANGACLNVLRGLNAKENPLKIIFLQTDANRFRGPVLVDPWGYPYQIRLDTNGDGQIQVGAETINAPVAVWSIGKNGRDENGKGDDDLASWWPPLLPAR